jgi:hypothetical protein
MHSTHLSKSSVTKASSSSTGSQQSDSDIPLGPAALAKQVLPFSPNAKLNGRLLTHRGHAKDYL